VLLDLGKYNVSRDIRKRFPPHGFRVTCSVFKGHYLKGKVIIRRKMKSKALFEEFRSPSI
jgi:hypothetical protein